jgi:phenylalanine-4-hydroxylase
MMKQEYNKYTQEDFEVWQLLFKRQFKNLVGKAHPFYFYCLGQLKNVLQEDSIPNFDDLNEELLKGQGWSIEVVPGLIPVKDFFKFLMKKRFCSSTWMRKRHELDYLEEPDMFHDIFGHVPLLMNEDYSNFTQEIGALGVKHWDNEDVIKQLQRLYWYTIEFGLIRENNRTEIYGAGIISSFAETNHVYEEGVNHIPYDIDECRSRDFIIPEVQVDYYAINNFSQLYTTLSKLKF